MTKAEALHYGKHASGCVLIDWRPQKDGRHRAIIDSHAFVLHRDNEALGCGHMEDCAGLGREVRCGYYRRHHATMLAVSA